MYQYIAMFVNAYIAVKNISTSSNIWKCIMLYNALYFAVYSHIFVSEGDSRGGRKGYPAILTKYFVPFN